MKNKIGLIILATVLLVFGFVVFRYTDNSNQQIDTNQDEVATTTETAVVDTSDWKIYENEEYGYQLKYPNDWENKKDIFLDSSLETNGFVPLETGNFPQCERDISFLVENYKKYQKPNDENGELIPSIRYNAIIKSCSIGILVKKNDDKLSIKDFLRKNFVQGTALDSSNNTKLIEDLKTQKINGVESVFSSNSFYLSGFGAGYENEIVPGIIPEKQQFIVSRENIIIFINNNINKEDLSLPENRVIFDEIIKSFKFIKSSQ